MIPENQNRPTVNFVVPYTEELVRQLRYDDPERIVRDRDPYLPLLSGGGPAAWCFLTYAQLRDCGYGPICLSSQLRPDCINVAHTDSLRYAPNYHVGFIVDVRADHSHRLFAQFTIVQNRDQIQRHAAWIHHWPQPGLIGRQAPVTAIGRVGYVGSVINHGLALDQAAWNKLLGSRGYSFVTPQSNNWHDLSSFDALVAIRSFNESPHSKKPASKLLNAWRAGIPLIGGHDSAYRQVGTPGEDYLIAGTPDEVVAALDSLNNDPALLRHLVANGHRRAAEYSNDAIARLWIETLEGPIAERYQQWERHRVREGFRVRTLKVMDTLQINIKQLVRNVTGSGPRTN